MRNTMRIIYIFIITSSLNAYEFSFFNATSTPIAIAIQFANSEKEPLYKRYIKQNTMNSFVPGTVDVPDIKWSFCLNNIYYIKNPTMEERAHNFAKVIRWKKATITWVNQPLQTTKKPKQSSHQKKQKVSEEKYKIIVTKKTIPQDNKSLCKDRHFEITEDEYDNIIITGSTIE